MGVEIRECLAALSGVGEEVKRLAMGVFRHHGGDLERWSSRHTKLAMAHALVAAEDYLDLSHRAVGRTALRAVRRRLELELA